MISVSQKIGRLTEVRMTAPIVLDDVTIMQRDMAALGAKAVNKLLVCADLSRANVFSEPVADRLGRFLRSDHQRIERVAVVVGASATFLMQVERLLRDITSPNLKETAREASAVDSAGAHANGVRAQRNGDGHASRRPPTRRAFRTSVEAISWLDDMLSADERKRLKEFLDPSA